MRIYCDLDNVLIHPVVDPKGNVVKIHPRPEADWFLSNLAQHGEVVLLTASSGDHPVRALRKLGKAASHLSGVITREDLVPIEEQIKVVQEADVDAATRRELWSQIQPIAPPGVIFDDYPVGSGMFVLKATAVGIGPEGWIQVDAYDPRKTDRGGLRRAYREFLRRFGRRRGVVA